MMWENGKSAAIPDLQEPFTQQNETFNLGIMTVCLLKTGVM